MRKGEMDMGVLKKWFEWSQAVTSMLLVQVIAAGLYLLSRIILSQGTFVFALMAYRHVVASVCVAPFAFFLERGNTKKLSWLVCFWLFLNALTGIIMAMGLFYYALANTTATYATNFLNLIPIVTFAFSIIAGIEKLGLGSRAGKMKVLGTLLCLAGALTTSLYKGKSFHIVHHKLYTHMTIKNTQPHWTRGTLMLVGCIFSYATWFIVQVQLLKAFPFKICATLYTCITAALQLTVIGLCLDRSKAAWRLGWNLQLVTIVYSILAIFRRKQKYGFLLMPGRIILEGILNSAATFWLISWVIGIRGPTYPSMFNPLSLIFVAVAEGLLLGEAITTGCLLGAIFIIVGLYSFLWGKKKELKSLSQPKVPDPVEVRQSTAVVIPTSSLVNSTNDVEGADNSLNQTSHNLP